MVFFVLAGETNSGTRCFLLLLFLFFISSISSICKNKITPLKELESSHPTSVAVNLTNISKVTTKYRRKIISKYRQKLLFIVIYRLVGTHDHIHIFCNFLMFEQIFLLLNFPIQYFFHIKTRVCRKYFVNDCRLKVNSSRSL